MEHYKKLSIDIKKRYQSNTNSTVEHSCSHVPLIINHLVTRNLPLPLTTGLHSRLQEFKNIFRFSPSLLHSRVGCYTVRYELRRPIRGQKEFAYCMVHPGCKEPAGPCSSPPSPPSAAQIQQEDQHLHGCN